MCFTDSPMKSVARRILFAIAALGSFLLFSGCRTEDELIGRPWNTPKSWETGLPSAMTEGR
jgi:hypothetical protein